MMKITIFLFFLFSSSFLQGCSEKKSNNIAVLINDVSNPYWQTFYEGVKETAGEINQDIDIYTLRHAMDAEAQLNQCEIALLKKPKALIFAAVNGVNLRPCLRKANQQGVLLVDADGNISQALAKELGVSVAFSVASNNYDLGTYAAQYLEGRSGKVLVLEGLSGSQPNILRVKGFKENLSDSMKIIASQPADWDRLKASNITNAILSAHPDLLAIFAANDMMALGAVETLRAVERKDIIVIGIDGVADAVQSIERDDLTASIAQLPYLMGREAVLKTDKYLSGEEIYDFNQYVPIITLDKEVLQSRDNQLLKHLR